MSATAHSALQTATGRQLRELLPRIGIVSARPPALFCYIDRDLGVPQWADVGMYLQTVMLLLRGEGLHSCTQMAWSVYRKTVAEILNPPKRLILFCGMSIGYEDVREPYMRTGRAPLNETVTFVDSTSQRLAQTAHDDLLLDV